MLDAHARGAGTGRAAENTRAGVLDDVDILATGTLGWIRNTMEILDPSATNGLSAMLQVKSSLELALLCRLWARFGPDDDGLDEVTSFVREIWQSSDFARLVAADTASDRLFALVYGALAPAGLTSGIHRATLAELIVDGDLTTHGKSAYSRLETRYYAELAGIEHHVESYAELYAASILATLAGTPGPITEMDAYVLTHTIWFLTDFGSRDSFPPHDDRERGLQAVHRITNFCIRRDKWDLLGELLVAQFCLGASPTDSSSMAAGVARLRQVQLASGAIPGRSVEQRPAESDTTADLFQKCFHPTLQASLAALAIRSAYT